MLKEVGLRGRFRFGVPGSKLQVSGFAFGKLVPLVRSSVQSFKVSEVSYYLLLTYYYSESTSRRSGGGLFEDRSAV